MKKAYEPKTDVEKIGYLVEECGEVLHAAGKMLRWGPDSVDPELPSHSRRETNAEWLDRELIDLENAINYAREVLAKRFRGARLGS